jgi:hypothetical protein
VDTMVELLTARDRATGMFGVADTADRERSALEGCGHHGGGSHSWG